MDENLYAVVDYILNKAHEGGLEVIQEALKRRLQDRNRLPMEYDPKSMAMEIASQIDDQVKKSVGSIKHSVRDYVTSLIRKHVPDIPEEHLTQLLKEWVPDPPGESRMRQGEPGDGPGNHAVPGEMLLTMISQFISYSTESMTASEQVRLEEEIPGWKEKYWALFPEGIRRLVRSYLEGQIGPDTCWQGVRKELAL